MSKPVITPTIGGYIFLWEAEHLKITANRIKTHNDGRVIGEVAIASTNSKSPHIHQAQFNFSSSTARRTLAKVLEERAKQDWYAILEQLSVNILQSVREGEPVTEMWAGLEDETVEPPKYLLEPFILENLPNVIFGDPSTLKTTTALALAGILLVKAPVLNLVPTQDDIRSLYLDWEVDYNTLRWQLSRLQKGMGLPPLLISYRRCHVPLSQDIEQIQKHIEKAKAKLLIIDSLGMASGKELNNSETALDFYTGLRKLKITSLILAHTSKEQVRDKTIIGHQLFTAQARNVWEVRKVQEAGEDEVSLSFFHTKPPPFAKKHRPIGYRFSFTETTTQIEPLDPKSVPEFVERMGNNQRVLMLLKEGLFEPVEIATRLQINQSSVRSSLKRLLAKNLVVKVDEKYGLQAQF